MLEYDFQESVGHWICGAAHSYQRLMNEELAPEGITWRQCQVLCWLALEDNIAQVELAERLDIEPPTLVRVLDRMERDGLIARGGCPNDRRRKTITPLPKAEGVWQQIVQAAQRVRAKATQGMSPEQLQMLRDLLACVRHNLESPKGTPEAAGASS